MRLCRVGKRKGPGILSAFHVFVRKWPLTWVILFNQAYFIDLSYCNDVFSHNCGKWLQRCWAANCPWLERSEFPRHLDRNAAEEDCCPCCCATVPYRGMEWRARLAPVEIFLSFPRRCMFSSGLDLPQSSTRQSPLPYSSSQIYRSRRIPYLLHIADCDRRYEECSVSCWLSTVHLRFSVIELEVKVYDDRTWIPTRVEWVLLLFLAGFLTAELDGSGNRSIVRVVVLVLCAVAMIFHIVAFVGDAILQQSNWIDQLIPQNATVEPNPEPFREVRIAHQSPHATPIYSSYF